MVGILGTLLQGTQDPYHQTGVDIHIMRVGLRWLINAFRVNPGIKDINSCKGQILKCYTFRLGRLNLATVFVRGFVCSESLLHCC